MADPDLDPPPAAAPSTVPARVPVPLGLIPQSLDGAWRMAQLFAKSDLLPKGYRGKPEDVLVAIQLGAELGLAPMQAIQSIAVINGKPTLYGDGLLAVVMNSPLYADVEESIEVGGVRVEGRSLTPEELKADTTAGVCTFHRHGAAPVTRRFSVAQARRANLVGKAGPWQEYPDRMLMMRARMFAARDAFPDVLRGIHAAEAEIETPPRRVRRVSEHAAAASSPPAPAAPEPEGGGTMGPATIAAIDEAAAGYVVTLDNHCAVYVDEAAAVALEPFVGGDRRLTFTVDDAFRLRSYAVLDDAAPATRPRDPALDSHACTWDAAGGRHVRAFCGALILRRDHTNDPTCPACREEIAARTRGDGAPF
jgi:hypothetical protein